MKPLQKPVLSFFSLLLSAPVYLTGQTLTAVDVIKKQMRNSTAKNPVIR